MQADKDDEHTEAAAKAVAQTGAGAVQMEVQIDFTSRLPPRPILNTLFYFIFGPQGHRKIVDEVIWSRMH